MPNCIICQSTELKTKFSLMDQYNDHFEWSECMQCGADFLNPTPTNEQLRRAYAEDYYGGGNKKFNPTVEKVLDLFRSAKAKGLSKLVEENSAVLDIGCADGEFLIQLSKFGNFKLHGLELEGRAAERAKERKVIQLHIGPLEMDSYESNQFDLISIVHVFEHLPNPLESIKIISKISKKGAYVYIEQPNIGSWQAKLFKDKWLHLDPPRHIHLLNDQLLIMIMEENGFELIHKRYFSPQFSPFGFQQSLLNLLCKKREVLYEHLKENVNYTSDYGSISLGLQKLFHWLSFPFFVITDFIASAFGKGATMKLVFRKV